MKNELSMATSIFEVMRKHNLSPGDSMVVLSMVAGLVIANSGNKWDAAGIEAFAKTVQTTIELLEEMQGNYIFDSLPPKELDAIADVVPAYRPKPKSKPAMKRKRKMRHVAKQRSNS